MIDAPPRQRSSASSNTSGSPEWTRYLFPLIPIWLFFEIGRPSITFRLPLLISVALFVGWLALPRKFWPPQLVCMVVLLGVAWFDLLIAANRYAAFSANYGLTLAFVFISIPMAHFVDSVQRLRALLWAWILISLYIAVWAITHGGFGPAGAGGGQDQNYVSLFMCMALPMTYFLMFYEPGMFRKAALGAIAGACILAIVVGFSRGGFVGLCAVGLYCWWHSPKKLVGLAAVAVFAVAVVAFAPSTYWEEMNTITDTSESTADLRLELWKIAGRQFLAYPITGVGPGNFLWRIEEFQTIDQFEKFGRSLGANAITHSLYFEVLAELGLAGVVLFGTLVFLNLRDMRRVTGLTRQAQAALLAERSAPAAARLAEDLRQVYYYALALATSLGGFLVCSLFLSTTYYSTFWVLTAAIVATRTVADRKLAEARQILGRIRASRRRPDRSSVALDPPAVPADGRLRDLLGLRSQ